MKKWFLILVGIVVGVGLSGGVWGQQVIGSFPSMDGGF
jgi:hypothetical protein